MIFGFYFKCSVVFKIHIECTYIFNGSAERDNLKDDNFNSYLPKIFSQ